MRISGFALSTLAAVLLAGPASGAEPPLRQPTGKWIVDFSEDTCLLQRNFGTAEKPLMLGLEPNPGSDSFDIYVFDERTGQSAARVPSSVRFGPGSTAVESFLTAFDMRSAKFRRSSLSLSGEDLRRSLANEMISIVAEERLNVSFQVPGLNNALKVLKDCKADLLDTWGFSREEQSSMAVPPKPAKDIIEYIDPEDYPEEAIMRDESGINSAYFTVRKDGGTKDCKIVQSSGSPSLDNTLCRATKRFRYSPALDKGGRPMEGLDFITVQWWLQKG